MSKKHKGGDHDEIHPDERWLITYADMITLLLAVFIVMYALSDTNLRKFNAFAQSLSSAFNTDVMSGSQQFTVTEGQATTPDAGKSAASVGYLGSEAQTIQTVVKNYAIQKGIQASMTVEVLPTQVRIQLGGELLFEAGRATLAPSSAATLTLVAQEILSGLKAAPGAMVRVEGNTDSSPVSGPFYADNWELSSARALTVLRFLRDSGVDPSRLELAANGASNPLPSTDPAAAANRRVEIVLFVPDASGGTASPTPAIESIAPTAPSFFPFGG
jgi:chemotaxis protein MotB